LTLRQHNESMRQLHEILKNANKAGVACDQCGAEMIYECKTSSVGVGQHVKCPKCNHRGFKQES